jgi:hypothetical protein
MKDWLIAFVLLFSGSVCAAAPAKPIEYNINVHVSASTTVKHSESALGTSTWMSPLMAGNTSSNQFWVFETC